MTDGPGSNSRPLRADPSLALIQHLCSCLLLQFVARVTGRVWDAAISVWEEPASVHHCTVDFVSPCERLNSLPGSIQPEGTSDPVCTPTSKGPTLRQTMGQDLFWYKVEEVICAGVDTRAGRLQDVIGRLL